MEIWVNIISIPNTLFSALHLHATLPDHLKFPERMF